MNTVRDLIRKKGTQVFAVKPDATVLEALMMMADKNTGAVMVMEGNKVAGILSERDCVRKLDLDGKTAKGTKVSEIMTSKVLYVEVTQSLDECMAIMIDKNIRHLPVYEEGKLLGLISVRDVLKEVVDYQKFMISQLEHYIVSSR
ncbi:MAG TPA: CBS domain-containing protein [Anaerolineales bacterium]|jgi:CBS domain-containing protein|nr:CBS domain-containing protein [Anaerolineales bacterium]